jgi:hypothetical protein
MRARRLLDRPIEDLGTGPSPVLERVGNGERTREERVGPSGQAEHQKAG